MTTKRQKSNSHKQWQEEPIESILEKARKSGKFLPYLLVVKRAGTLRSIHSLNMQGNDKRIQ